MPPAFRCVVRITAYSTLLTNVTMAVKPVVLLLIYKTSSVVICTVPAPYGVGVSTP